MTAGARPAHGAVALRRLRWWDVAAVAELERGLFGGTAWSAETFWSELAQPSRWYVVAQTADGALAGYAGVMVTGAEADVQTVAVAPAAQGCGVGARLLAALVEEAGARGATSLLLEVRADNAPAIRLYRRFGFERIAVRRRYYQPDDVDALVLRLRPLPRTVPVGAGPADAAS
ncbi:MAG TPA: ribosomal protein S18-alanine N-acetyltransferase [Kineosporiaceae bacterium]